MAPAIFARLARGVSRAGHPKGVAIVPMFDVNEWRTSTKTPAFIDPGYGISSRIPFRLRLIPFGEAPQRPAHQPVIEREELEADNRRRRQSGALQIADRHVERPGRVRQRR